MGRAAEIQQIKYLSKMYPIRCSEIEQLYFKYVEDTNRTDFVGFENTYLTKEINMRKDKLVKAAEGAKAAGYEFLSALIMVKEGKRLYNVVHVDDIIRIGHWLPASIRLVKNETGKEQPVFVATDTLPEKHIDKSEALRRFGK